MFIVQMDTLLESKRGIHGFDTYDKRSGKARATTNSTNNKKGQAKCGANLVAGNR